MSGIYGIINLKNQPVEQKQMEALELNMIHRGVDGKAQWLDNHVGLGHLKLEITPESAYENLPLTYKQWVITADARIDNRDELDDPLSISEAERPFTPDSTYIVKAYEQWGEDCVKHLIGDFAFAIWDTVEKTLFCARDHIGIKPFFYLKTEDKFIFSSEIKPLVNSKEIPVELNEKKLADFMNYVHDLHMPDDTLFRSIKKLSPAHSGFLRNNFLNLKKYWELRREKSIQFENEELYISELRELIIKAVECRIRTKYSIGISLSGGLDSSAIASIAARKLHGDNRKLYASSSVLPDSYSGAEQDEKHFVAALARQEKNIKVSYVAPPNLSFIENGYFTGETFSITGIFYAVDAAIRESMVNNNEKIRVMLSGFGGDMAASYNGQYVLLHSLANLNFQKFFTLLISHSKEEKKSIISIIISDLIKPALSKFFLRTGNKNKKYFNSGFKDKFNTFNIIEKFNTNNIYSNISTDIANCVFDFEYFNLVSTHSQIEESMPLVDIRVLEYIMSLPTEKFLLLGKKRGIFRQAMKGLLPSIIQVRKNKNKFYPNYEESLIQEYNKINDFLLKNSFVLEKYFNINEIMNSLGNRCNNLYTLGFYFRLIQFITLFNNQKSEKWKN